MKISIVTPAPPKTRHGNRVTALRWAQILRFLGHKVEVKTRYYGDKCDVLIALHAQRSSDSIRAYRDAHPDGPLILALTGTDVYRDIVVSDIARQSLELADKIVALQGLAKEEIPTRLWGKFVPIIQSAVSTTRLKKPVSRSFDVSVVGHLRPVKDPFRAAMASRLLPQRSKLRVLHVGGAMDAANRKRAEGEMARNPRYRWLGERPHWKTREIMFNSQLLVLSSKLEGGANVISEALADQVPIICSYISGSIGLLGNDHPGYFELGNTRELAKLLSRAEFDPNYLKQLHEASIEKSKLVDPSLEIAGWKNLLDGIESAM